MFQIVTTFIIVASLFLSAGGITTFAAQTSLPDGPLYGLKLWSEEARLNLAGPQQDWRLALEFAERRAAEIRRMVEDNQVPPDSLQVRLRQQLERAIQLAVSRPDEEARAALEQVSQRLQEQSRLMNITQRSPGQRADVARVRARQTIQERQRWAESGIVDPNGLREQFRLGLMGVQASPGEQERWRYGTAQPGGVEQPGGGPCLSCTPQGQQLGGNPWTTGTPTQSSGYGDGWGGNPWTTGTPTPDSGYGPGPGPGDGTTCTPGAKYGPGPNPTDQPGSGPGPNPTEAPGKKAGPKPTEPPGNGPGPQPTQEDVDGGGQPDQGGVGPQEPSPPKNGGKP